jgi:hypothetical protein
MKIASFLTKISRKRKEETFADFFLHASREEKKRVFTHAAKKANEDQRMLMKDAVGKSQG